MKHQDALELMRKSLILKSKATNFYYKMASQTPDGKESFVYCCNPRFEKDMTFSVDFFEESEINSLWEIAGEQKGNVFVCHKKDMEVSK